MFIWIKIWVPKWHALFAITFKEFLFHIKEICNKWKKSSRAKIYSRQDIYSFIVKNVYLISSNLFFRIRNHFCVLQRYNRFATTVWQYTYAHKYSSRTALKAHMHSVHSARLKVHQHTSQNKVCNNIWKGRFNVTKNA